MLLPVEAFESLAAFLNACERAGALPDAFHHTYVRLIPKPDVLPPLAPLKLRPIAVMNLVWRAYASVRTRQHRQWSEKHMHPAVKGGRPGHSGVSAWTAIALTRELARRTSQPWLAVALDSEKFYDRLPRDVCFGLLRHLGGHPGFAQLLEHQYSRMYCTWRVGAGCSLPQALGRTGLSQGCPAAVMVVNLLQSIRARLLSKHCVDTSVWVDDLLISSTRSAEMQDALDTSAAFDVAMGAKVNAAKSGSLQDRCRQPLTYQGKALPRADSLTYLGHAVGGDGKWRNRANAARYRLARPQFAPLDVDQKARVVESSISPLLSWGACGALPPVREVQGLARSTWTAVWGHKRRRRCIQLVTTLLFPGHAVDPVQALVYAVLFSFATASPHLQAQWSDALLHLAQDPPLKCWARNTSKHAWINNPVETLYQALWFCHSHTDHPSQEWLSQMLHALSDKTKGPHNAREMIRQSVRNTIVRDDLRAVADHGIDPGWGRNLKKRPLPGLKRSTVATILAGAWLTGQEDTPEAPCQHCEQPRPEGGRKHLWWDCPVFQAERDKAWENNTSLLHRTVRCGTTAFLKCGILTTADRTQLGAHADLAARNTLCMMHNVAVAASSSEQPAAQFPPSQTPPPLATKRRREWTPALWHRNGRPRAERRAGSGFALAGIGPKRPPQAVQPTTPAEQDAALLRVKRLRTKDGNLPAPCPSIITSAGLKRPPPPRQPTTQAEQDDAFLRVKRLRPEEDNLPAPFHTEPSP